MSMKPLAALSIVLIVFSCLLYFSYHKILAVESESLTLINYPSLSYNRDISFHVTDPSISLFPHWILSYHEYPTDPNTDTAFVVVGMTDSILTAGSKELNAALSELGYEYSN